MTQNKNTATIEEQINAVAMPDQVAQDFKNSVLIVSVIVNLSMLTTWITLQVA
jgi:hypothetical protein